MSISRRELLMLGTTACLGAATLSGAVQGKDLTHTTAAWRRAEIDPGSFRRVATGQPWLALTFDDGPDPQFTPTVLQTLDHFGVRATFFVVGSNALAHPDLIRAALAAGHEVANHSLDHAWLDALTETEVGRQVDGGAEAMTRVGAPASPWFRPPRGWTSPSVVRAVQRRGARSAYWTHCLEADAGTAAQAGRAAADACSPGSVLLTHDGGRVVGPNPQAIDRSRSVEALPHLLRAYEKSGLRPVPLGDLVRSGEPQRI